MLLFMSWPICELGLFERAQNKLILADDLNSYCCSLLLFAFWLLQCLTGSMENLNCKCLHFMTDGLINQNKHLLGFSCVE